MILNTIIAISILILSVVKTADLFIYADKNLNLLQERFIEQTRKLNTKDNERGSVSLTAAVLTTLLSCLLLFFVTKMKVEYQEALYRKDSYLCFHYLNVSTEKYIKEMANFNLNLRTAFIAKSTGVATAEAELAFRVLTYTRNMRHLLYIKKLLQNNYCRIPETLTFLKNPPFRLTPLRTLETNLDETTMMRTPQWTYTYYKNPKNIRLKKSFCLKSEFQMKNDFFPNPHHTTKEITMADLSSWKCFSGSS